MMAQHHVPSNSAPAAADPTRPHASDDTAASRPSAALHAQVDLPPLPDFSPHPWNKLNEKQLRSALIGACKRMPRNAEAHFHVALMHMRNGDYEDAFRSFQHCRQLLTDRKDQYSATHADDPPVELRSKLARVHSHAVQAAHLWVLTHDRENHDREQHAAAIEKLQADLVSASKLDFTQPDVWNEMALLHLNEGGVSGARGAQAVLTAIRHIFPDYLDVLNNLGLAELALGNEELAISCFQKVILVDRQHVEALSNYAVVLLRHAMYDAAIRAFDTAVEAAAPDARGLAFAWGGLAVAHAAMGRLEAAETAARRAEVSSDPANRPKFAMLRTSICARRIVDTFRRGLPWNDDATPSFESPDHPPSPSHAAADAPPLLPTHSDVAPANGETANDDDAGDDGNDNDGQHMRAATDAGDSIREADGTSGSGGGSGDGRVTDDATTPLQQQQQRTGLVGSPGAEQLSAMDRAVMRLRALARDVHTSAASTALGTALRLRHDCAMEEKGNRNFGAEAAERLVEALEMDNDDATAWVQLALLQFFTGEYASARFFAEQAVSRDDDMEAGWNALGVSAQLNDQTDFAFNSYAKAKETITEKYNVRGRRGKTGRPRGGEEGNASDEDGSGALMFPLETSKTLKQTNDGKEVDGAATDAPSSGKAGKATIAGGTLGDREDGSKQDREEKESSKTEDKEKGLNEVGRIALAAVYNNIGNMKRQEGRSFAESLEAYEKSLSVGGEHAVVYNNLALLYISAGRFEDAGNMLDHALKLDSKLDCVISNRLKLTSLIRRNERRIDGGGETDDDLDFINSGGKYVSDVRDGSDGGDDGAGDEREHEDRGDDDDDGSGSYLREEEGDDDRDDDEDDEDPNDLGMDDDDDDW